LVEKTRLSWLAAASPEGEALVESAIHQAEDLVVMEGHLIHQEKEVIIEDQATETEMDARPEATGLQMEGHLWRKVIVESWV
jgi:hypothetical protein